MIVDEAAGQLAQGHGSGGPDWSSIQPLSSAFSSSCSHVSYSLLPSREVCKQCGDFYATQGWNVQHLFCLPASLVLFGLILILSRGLNHRENSDVDER